MSVTEKERLRAAKAAAANRTAKRVGKNTLVKTKSTPLAKSVPSKKARQSIPQPSKSVAVELRLNLGGVGNERELDDLTRLLSQEIRSLDVKSVEMIGDGVPPSGSKGVSFALLGGLLVKLASSTALKNVIAVVQAWTSRNSSRSVKIVIGGNSIEVANITANQQQRLIKTFELQIAGAAASKGNV